MSGAIQFMRTLLTDWKLSHVDATALFGLGSHAAREAVLAGRQRELGDDLRERVAHLLWLRSSLWGLFRSLEAENAWLRASHPLLGGQRLLPLLLTGRRRDLLTVRDYVDAACGR